MEIHFKGGLEPYFDNLSKHELTEQFVTQNRIKSLEDLILYYQNNYFDASKVFRNGDLAPGHLCFINDTDYEVKGNKFEINYGDKIFFISTMHGG